MPQKMFSIVVVMIVTTVALVLALLGLDSGIVPIVLGVSLALFLPGYALIAMVAPDTFSRPARVLLSMEISIILTVSGRFVLSSTPWGLHLVSWAVYLGSITMVAAIIALIRHGAGTTPRSVRQPRVRPELVGFGLAAVLVIALVVGGIGALQQPDTAVAHFLFGGNAQAAPTTAMLRETNRSASMALSTITEAPPTPVPTTIPSTPVPATVVEANTPTATPLTATTVVEMSTPTAAPTAEETFSPTATMPAASPTPQASNTQAANQLDISLSDWPTRTTDTASLSFADGQYRLMIDGQPGVGVSSVLLANNYRLGIDMALENGMAGVTFLAVEPITFYRILFNTEGAYTIQQVHQNSDDVSAIVDWTASTALQASENIRVQIQRQGDTLEFSANDQPLTTIDVPDSPVTNQVGVVLANSSERGQVTFTDLVVEQLSDQ